VVPRGGGGGIGGVISGSGTGSEVTRTGSEVTRTGSEVPRCGSMITAWCVITGWSYAAISGGGGGVARRSVVIRWIGAARAAVITGIIVSHCGFGYVTSD